MVSDSDSKPSNPGRFQPGKSGNPGGRAKGLERRVREMLGNDIDGIVYVQRCVALGVAPDPARLAELGVDLTAAQVESVARTFSTISRRDANEAAKLLTDRGWGKARQTIDLSGDVGGIPRVDYSQLSDEELDRMLEADAIAERATRDGGGADDLDAAPATDGPARED